MASPPPNAKGVAGELATTLGFEAIDAGGSSGARQLEQLAVLWISLAYGIGGAENPGRDFAFRIARR